jgi:dynein heavy chain, axonemal
MTLCLANGQRIKLRHQMRMLFEVQDLSVASPATVSRCGMVYMTPEELGWKPYVRSWIPRMYPDESILLDEHK